MGTVYTQLSLKECRRIEDWWHAKVPVREMARELNRLNATPRKCLGWKTPAEVFREKMMEEMGRKPYPHKE